MALHIRGRAPSLTLRNVGQISESYVQFGDLTVLVGPQASGKSIALQWLKLLEDSGSIKAQLIDYGIDWAGQLPEFLDLYFGEGMRQIWRDASEILWGEEPVDVPALVRRKSSGNREAVFLIPAQRVMTLRDGWPRPFGDYRTGDPYAVRAYSEELRILVEREFGTGEALFPKRNRLKDDYRKMLQETLFADFRLSVDKVRSQKRLVLETKEGALPYMVWSAGQREFVPLLLGLYWLMPGAKVPRRNEIKWVIIEELEMGLHPRAISTVLLMVLELIVRGYRVCLSTHSPQVLDMVWAWQTIRSNNGQPDDLLDLFGARHSQPLRDVAVKALTKSARVYYFEAGQTTKDITSLDPSSDSPTEATWGGLLEFSGRANEKVAESVARAEDKLKSAKGPAA